MSVTGQQGWGGDVLDVTGGDARPNAIVPMVGAQTVLDGLDARDVRRGGCWLVAPHVWQRFDRAWAGPDEPAGAQLVGSVYLAPGTPGSYDVVVHQVSVTRHGVGLGWTPERLCDEALAPAGLRLADCERAVATLPPQRPMRRR